VISQNDALEAKNIRTAKLIELAEKAYQAILANIADDQGVSKALGELRSRIRMAYE
jgi:hypothetical protein